MRVLHLVKHSRHGHGNVHVAVDLACMQAARGHAVMYASAGGDFDPLLREHGVVCEDVVQDRQSAAAMARSFFGLVGLCRAFRPDVIHAHMMSSAVFGYGAGKLAGIPLVTTVHNSFDRQSLLMRLGRRVVAVSQAERVALLARGFGKRQVMVVLNGPNDSPRDGFGAAPGIVLPAKSIVTLCGLHQRKGVHDLIGAFAAVQAEFPDWRFYIIGDGPDRAKLEAMAADLCAPGSVQFLGSIDRPHVLLKQAAIFLLGSYAEPFGLVVAEARNAGCAVIASDVGGIPEILDAGMAGQLVAAGQPAAFAAALRPLLADEAVLREWQRRSGQDIAHMTVRRVVDEYDEVYRAVG